MSFFLFLFLALSETSYRQLEVNICSSAVLEKANIKKSKDSSIMIMNNKTLAKLDIKQDQTNVGYFDLKHLFSFD